jgi:hypothetical protein
MQTQMYPGEWRWDLDEDGLKGRFARIDQGLTAPKSGKVADVLVLDVDGVERSLWLWTVALKRFAARPQHGGVSRSANIAIQHQGTTTLDKEQGLYRRGYRFSVNGEAVTG